MGGGRVKSDIKQFSFKTVIVILFVYMIFQINEFKVPIQRKLCVKVVPELVFTKKGNICSFYDNIEHVGEKKNNFITSTLL